MFDKCEKAIMAFAYATILVLGFVAGILCCCFDSHGFIHDLFFYDANANVELSQSDAIQEFANIENASDENEGINEESNSVKSSVATENESEESITQIETPISDRTEPE